MYIKVGRSFVCKVRKEQNENTGGELHYEEEKATLSTPCLTQNTRVHGMINESPSRKMRHPAKD